MKGRGTFVEGFHFTVVLPDAPSMPRMPTIEPIDFKRTTSSTASSGDADFWTWVQAFMGQPAGFAFHYTQADEPDDPKQKRAARMEALGRMAAPGSGATDPERATAQRILDRMRSEEP
jgi:hypothetical protein